MKKSWPIIISFAIIFLLFIQAAGTLVESIYILDLMHSNLDAKVLGVLFFFTPLLLIPFLQEIPAAIGMDHLCAVGGITQPAALCEHIQPDAGSRSRHWCSLEPLLPAADSQTQGETKSQTGLWGSAGLALAVSLSVLLRTVYFGLDYSLTVAGGWSGILLGLLLAGVLTQLDLVKPPVVEKKAEE